MIHKLINMHRIKFNILKEVLACYKSEPVVNIHIDLHSVLAEIYKDRNHFETSGLSDSQGMTISSCIINLAAHYRLFFQSNYNTSTRIFFYFAKRQPRNNAEYIPTYGQKFFDKYSETNVDFITTNHEVLDNLELCRTIMPYIPGVFYIDCDNIEPVVAAAHHILRYNEPHLVITKDEYWFQLVNVTPDTRVLRLKRDASYLVDRSNVYQTLLSKSQFRPQFVSPELLSVVYSFTGVKSRDIRGITGYGYSKILKVLDQAVNRNQIKNSYTHIKNILDEIYNGPEEDLLMDIFRAIDLRYQLNELTLGQKEIINDCIINRYNRKDLLALNNKYYTGEESLMLEELFRGIGRIDKLTW